VDCADVAPGVRASLAVVATLFVGVGLVQCDEPEVDDPASLTAEQQAERVRERVESFGAENAEFIRSHRPDDALEFESHDAGN